VECGSRKCHYGRLQNTVNCQTIWSSERGPIRDQPQDPETRQGRQGASMFRFPPPRITRRGMTGSVLGNSDGDHQSRSSNWQFILQTTFSLLLDDDDDKCSWLRVYARHISHSCTQPGALKHSCQRKLWPGNFVANWPSMEGRCRFSRVLDGFKVRDLFF
jgi:hypothetical protein